MPLKNFPRQEKLKGKHLITELFASGKWKNSGNLRIIHVNIPGIAAPKIGVSAPKRNFKKAVDRNRIKRLLREAYRNHKENFAGTFGKETVAMIFWTSREIPESYQAVEENFINLCKSNI